MWVSYQFNIVMVYNIWIRRN